MQHTALVFLSVRRGCLRSLGSVPRCSPPFKLWLLDFMQVCPPSHPPHPHPHRPRPGHLYPTASSRVSFEVRPSMQQHTHIPTAGKRGFSAARPGIQLHTYTRQLTKGGPPRRRHAATTHIYLTRGKRGSPEVRTGVQQHTYT